MMLLPDPFANIRKEIAAVVKRIPNLTTNTLIYDIENSVAELS